MIIISIFKNIVEAIVHKPHNELPPISKYKIGAPSENGDYRSGSIDNSGLNILLEKENKNVEEEKIYKYSFKAILKNGKEFNGNFESSSTLETFYDSLNETKGDKFMILLSGRILVLDKASIESLDIKTMK